jgi:hypothetical protein
MRLAGIPDNFGVYSIKHTTIVSKQYVVIQDQKNI